MGREAARARKKETVRDVRQWEILHYSGRRPSGKPRLGLTTRKREEQVPGLVTAYSSSWKPWPDRQRCISTGPAERERERRCCFYCQFVADMRSFSVARTWTHDSQRSHESEGEAATNTDRGTTSRDEYKCLLRFFTFESVSDYPISIPNFHRFLKSVMVMGYFLCWNPNTKWVKFTICSKTIPLF